MSFKSGNKENDSLKIKLAKRDNEINKLTKENMVLAKTLSSIPKSSVVSSADRYDETTELEHNEFKVIDNIVANKKQRYIHRSDIKPAVHKSHHIETSNIGKVFVPSQKPPSCRGRGF